MSILDFFKTSTPVNQTISEQQLRFILNDYLSHFTASQITEFTNALNTIPVKYGIDTVDKFIMFLSQTAYESVYFTELEENLNYSAARLLQVWPARFTTDNANDYAHNPEKLANRVYADRNGNNDEASGDGWKYRGRGIIQLTFKDNYQNLANSIKKTLDDTVLYCSTITGAVESACWFWKNKGLSIYDHDVVGATRIINGGENGLDDRQALYNKVKAELSPG